MVKICYTIHRIMHTKNGFPFVDILGNVSALNSARIVKKKFFRV